MFSAEFGVELLLGACINARRILFKFYFVQTSNSQTNNSQIRAAITSAIVSCVFLSCHVPLGAITCSLYRMLTTPSTYRLKWPAPLWHLPTFPSLCYISRVRAASLLLGYAGAHFLLAWQPCGGPGTHSMPWLPALGDVGQTLSYCLDWVVSPW